MATFHIRVTQDIEVTLDEAKFDNAFMGEFREGFYQFTTLEEHAQHLGQLYARGLAEDWTFIEGYGPATEMGIKFTDISFEKEVVK